MVAHQRPAERQCLGHHLPKRTHRTRTTSTRRPAAWGLTTPAIAWHSDNSCIETNPTTSVFGVTARVRLDITGVVQGVGFRPAVARIAADPPLPVVRYVSDDPHYLTDNPVRRCPALSKLRGLGWTPEVGLDEGIARALASYREQPVGAPA